ncbi:hypothetical protein [Gemmata sp.]|uniref:hypothetical protein n=1 Tax=Gemmata sp. TaxID=1914242 RepID=UPI003F7189F3
MDPVKWLAERLWDVQKQQFIRDGLRRHGPPDPVGQRVRAAGAAAVVVACVVVAYTWRSIWK